MFFQKNKKESGKRDSNSRPQPWQGCALPTELFPQSQKNGEEEETRTPTSQLTLPPQSSASTNSATSPTYFRCKKNLSFYIQCPEQDSNLHASRHTHLKRARLPIPPPGHFMLFIKQTRAENETRTRDPNLGKVVLYQLSYFRIFLISQVLFSKSECKGRHFFLFHQTFSGFFFAFIEFFSMLRNISSVTPYYIFIYSTMK